MTYNYNYEPTGAEGIIAGLLAVLGIVIVVGLIVGIILIIARWKIFTKAGEEGWKAIIPVYGDMVLCKIAGVWEWYPLAILGISFVVGMISGLAEGVGSLLSLAAYAASIYYTVIISISVAQSFGKDTGFGIGLMFLNIIFYPILGFGKAEYVGPRPMKDPIMGAIAGKQTTTSAPAAPAAGGNFCPQCGASNPADSEFCQKCGNKLK